MPTKVVLIADLLEKRLDAPTDWSFGIFPFFGWYHFSQTVHHSPETTITNVVLKITIYAYLNTGLGEYGNVGVGLKFNDTLLEGERHLIGLNKGWVIPSKSTRTLSINVTDKYRALTGTVPQMLSIAINSKLPFYTEYITVTAYLEIEYTGTEPQRLTGGSAIEIPQELLSLITEMMFTMFMFTLVINILGGMFS